MAETLHAYTIPPYCECCGGPPPQTLITEEGHRPSFLCHRCAWLEHTIAPPPGCVIVCPDGTRVTSSPDGWVLKDRAHS